MPKLSVITINLNNCSGLKNTIQSVITQTNKHFEFIVIDGGSNDGSEQLIDRYKQNISYTVSERDSGIYSAMNKGIVCARGEYLLFLNSGDCFHDIHTVENVQDLLYETDVISGDINIFDKDRWSIYKSEDALTISYFLKISLYHQATFIRKNLFLKRGMYDENFRSCGDYEFFIRTLLKQNGSYKHIPLVISNFIADGISNSESHAELNTQEREMAWRLNFSDITYQHFQNSMAIFNSKELKWGRRFFRFFPFANLIDKMLARIWY